MTVGCLGILAKVSWPRWAELSSCIMVYDLQHSIPMQVIASHMRAHRSKGNLLICFFVIVAETV